MSTAVAPPAACAWATHADQLEPRTSGIGGSATSFGLTLQNLDLKALLQRLPCDCAGPIRFGHLRLRNEGLAGSAVSAMMIKEKCGCQIGV